MLNIARIAAAVALAALTSVAGASAATEVPAEETESVHPENRGTEAEEAAEEEIVLSQEPDRFVEILPDRSLFVRHPALLGGLTFEAVMEQLADSAGAADGTALFRQWWATLAPGTAADVAAGLACPAEGVSEKVPTLGDFPMLCDERFADIAAMENPLGIGEETPPFRIIGLVNRIDLRRAEVDIPDCGEYRVIASWNPDWDGWPAFGGFRATQMFMIFEAAVPDSADGTLCPAIQEFWARFSNPDESGVIPTDADVADALARFYLTGGKLTADGRLLPEDSAEEGLDLAPVLLATNLGGEAGPRRGQIRVNNLSAEGWVLREFEFASDGDMARIVVMPVSGSIDPSVMEGDTPENRGLALELERGFGDLMEPGINNFTLNFDTALQASQMVVAAFGPPVPSYAVLLRQPRNDVRRKLLDLSGANPIVMRLEALSCAGCHHNVADSSTAGFVDHEGRPVRWPGSINFTHILPEIGADGGYKISDLVKCTALPFREMLLRAALGGNVVDPSPSTEPPAGCAFHYVFP
jgi:hypothetical protein